MRINNNVTAINAHRNYSVNNANVSKSMAKLSSGYRINSAADDAAGLAISEKMRAQIRGLNMASKNAQDGISLIQTAEGGMQEIDNMLQRIRELVVYASNDTQENNAYGTGDRQKIQDEISQLTQEIDATAERIDFNGKKLLNGEVAGVPVGAANLIATLKAAKELVRTSQADYSQALQAYKSAATGVQATKDSSYSILTDPNINTLVNNISLHDASMGNSVSSVLAAIADVKGELNRLLSVSDMDATGSTVDVASALSKLTALVDSLTSTDALASSSIDSLKNILGGGGTLESVIGTSAATNASLWKALDNYQIKNTDLTSALGAMNVAKSGLAGAQAAYNGSEKSGGLYFQIGANANQGVQLYVNSIKTDWLNIGDGNGVSTINVLDHTGSNITASIDNVDFALSYVTTERSKLGASQNRLEYTMNSLDASAENLQAAESRIRDVDMATEMTHFTKNNILFQASTAMLAQANAFPQGVLQLLQG
jgi:flagellin